jgi:hypothetical protein
MPLRFFGGKRMAPGVLLSATRLLSESSRAPDGSALTFANPIYSCVWRWIVARLIRLGAEEAAKQLMRRGFGRTASQPYSLSQCDGLVDWFQGRVGACSTSVRP